MTPDSILKLIILIVTLVVTTSCNEDKIEVSNKYLGSSTLIESRDVDYAKTMGSVTPGFDEEAIASIVDGIDVYEIHYKTVNLLGESITASGLVILPATLTNVPMLAYQRELDCYPFDVNIHNFPVCRTGEKTPTNNPSTPGVNAMKAMAGSGFVTMVPDLLGFGFNSGAEHPYDHGNSLGSVSLDMIKATKELMAEKNVTSNDKLFLAGYGIGGYGTMALHKYIEDYSDLEVTMSAPGAGLYDKTLLATTLFSTNTSFYGYTEFLLSLESYNKIYNLGLRSSEFSEEFLKGRNIEIREAIADNDRSDWSPRGPITIFQPTLPTGGHNDWVWNEIPLHENGRATYTKLLENGARVELIEFPDKNFDIGIAAYLKAVHQLFYDMK